MRYFVLWTMLGMLAVPGTAVLIALRMYLWSVVTAAIAVVLRLDSVRAMIRAGAIGKSPRVCGSPKESDQELMKLFDKNPTVVGSAWGFFLQRRSACGPVLSLRNYVGHVGHGEWWAAGTTIRDVCDHYLAQSVTLPSHPSIDSITIGAWLATGSHGNGGNAGKPSSSVVHTVKLVHIAKKSTKYVTYDKMRIMVDNDDWIVTWVKFHNLVDNVWLRKDAFTVNSPGTAARWLREGAVLRVLFVGAARDGLGIRWDKLRPGDRCDHVDPHCCSRCATFVQADVCSAVCGCREPYEMWRGVTTLRNANRWTPRIYPIETLIAVVGGVMNFELVFRMVLTNHTLYEMCNALRDMHKDIGGRTEIRFGTEVVFWDLSLQHSFFEPVRLLSEFGVKQAAFHPGKYNPRCESMSGINFVKIGEIYMPNTVNNKLTL